jgi:hypothetical protein
MRKLLPFVVFVAGAAGCVPEAQYVFHPAEQATAVVAGHPAARYDVPPESPRGSVRVATFGVRSLATSSGVERTLHVRMTIANNNDTGPWQLDADALRVAYSSGEQAAPLCVNARAASAPNVVVEPGDAAVVDAWFPLPAGAEGAAQVPRFDLAWQVSTPERDVAERTPFERIRIEPELASAGGADLGTWPAWWYDPFLFARPPVVVRERPRVYVFAPRRR